MKYAYLQLGLYGKPRECEILDSWYSINSNCMFYRVRMLDNKEEYVQDEVYGFHYESTV